MGFAALLSVACTQGSPERTPSQLPVPIVAATKGAKSWTMVPWNGEAVYRFSRAGTISSDSSEERPVATSSESSERLARNPAPGGASFELWIAEPSRSSNLRRTTEKVSGSFTAMQLTLEPSPGTVPCDPARAQLRADLAELSFPLAATIAGGESWTDSVSNEACVSGIAGTARTRRHFLVVGDTTLANAAAVIVHRRDSLALSGEGALNRHAITLSANGVADARIYLSVPEGKLLRLEKEMLLQIAVTSSSHTRNFVQHSTSAAELSR